MKEKEKSLSFTGVILGVILIALIVISLFRSLNNSPNDLTFTGFLEYLSTCPSIEFVDINGFTIVADWKFFNFFRDFLNWFSKPVAVVIWLGQNVMNLLAYLIYFLNYLLL